jgi:hypothetical protein
LQPEFDDHRLSRGVHLEQFAVHVGESARDRLDQLADVSALQPKSRRLILEIAVVMEQGGKPVGVPVLAFGYRVELPDDFFRSSSFRCPSILWLSHTEVGDHCRMIQYVPFGKWLRDLQVGDAKRRRRKQSSGVSMRRSKNGIIDVSDPSLKTRITELTATGRSPAIRCEPSRSGWR